MSERAEGSRKESEGKKPHVNKPTSKKWKMYSVVGENIKREKSCFRCGAGVFLAIHKDRMTCGKCKYTEFLKK